jgi:hypothetical protein
MAALMALLKVFL